MATVTYQAPTSNYWSTTLNGSINDSADTITLSSTTGLQEPGVVVINREDGNGNATPNSREVVPYTGISGNDLTGCTRGGENSTARSHSSGALVEAVFTVGQWNDLVDAYQVAHEDTGVHKASIALTTPKITTSINDSAGNEVIKTPATASAVNEITVTNAAANGSPSVTATGDDTNINLLASGKGTGLFIPQIPLAEGQMINGKLSVTVASNNLTVALKTNSGADPSAASPVYVMIGGTLRSVTGALSTTQNAGANYGNAGSAELATKEIDWFVYLAYNAGESAVQICFSRIPYGAIGTDFNFSGHNEKYLYHTGDAPNGADDTVTVIGRFAATLSAGAGYTWTVPTFTATNLIQRPIYETRWLNWLPTWTGSGSLTYTETSVQQYCIKDSVLYMIISANGTAGGVASTHIICTVPMSAVDHTTDIRGGGTRNADTSTFNGSWYLTTPNFVYFDGPAFGDWTTGANRGIYGELFYRLK